MAVELKIEPGAVIVGIAGAGVMGAGIAQVAALAGHSVRLYDAQPGAAHAAVERIAATIEELARRKKLSAEEARSAAQRLRAIGTVEEFSGCGLILEAIVENLEAKQSLFREIEAVADPEALLASNTSSLSITAIAAALKRPERLAGMHFFNPAPLMPLVEVVHGASTSPETAGKLAVLAQSWAKTAVRARSTPGFIVNRVARPFYAEALRVLEEGAADCATIDAILRESGGFRMGPFELMDLIGNDVNYAVTRSVFDAFYGDPRFTPSSRQLELVQAGRLGRKSGRGFYEYENGKPVAAPSTAAWCMPPARIQIHRGTALAQTLAERLSTSTVQCDRVNEHSDGRVAGWENTAIYPGDGRTATARAAATGMRNTILMDLALDGRAATRAAIAAADQADRDAVRAATGLLQAAGYAVSVIDDVPGMVVLRTVAMLANFAADAVSQGVCSVADVDLAMRKGVNYPRGPLEWADAIGCNTILQALDHLAAAYGEDRYRACPLLRRKALTGSRFTPPDASEAAPLGCDARFEPVRG